MNYDSSWRSLCSYPVPEWFRAVYATCLGVPGDEMFINSFKLISPEEIKGISMLGVPGALKWRHDLEEGLIIETPVKVPSEYANTFKIEMAG